MSDTSMVICPACVHEFRAIPEEVQRELAQALTDNKRLRVALRFYAGGQHYNTDDTEEFDTVSGEPQNWLCSGKEHSTTMIEVGQVARFALLGEPINWLDGDDDTTPQPIDGERVLGAA